MNKIFEGNSSIPEVSGLGYYNDCNAFGNIFEILNSKNDFNEVIEYLERFFSIYPLQRSALLSLYAYNMTSRANSKIAHEAIRIFVEATERVARIGRDQFNAPLVVEHNGFLTRLGETADQVALTYFYQALGKITEKPIIYSPKKPHLANQAFLPYIEDYFEVIIDPSLQNYFRNIAPISPFQPAFFKYSNSQYGHNSNFFLDCRPDLVSRGVDAHPFKLKDKTIEKAMKFLSPYGLKLTDDFVVLHLRELGYFDAPHHKYRNANPQEFEESVDYFLQQGLKVIRIGHSKMTPMKKRSGFIDLTQVIKPDEVDLFLCGQAKLYFGSGSGPLSVASHFGVPCSEAWRIPCTGVRDNHFAQNVTFRDKETGKIIRWSDFYEKHVVHIQAPIVFDQLGWIPYFPNSTENLKFAQESFEYIQKGTIFHLNNNYKSQREKFYVWGGLCSESLTFLD